MSFPGGAPRVDIVLGAPPGNDIVGVRYVGIVLDPDYVVPWWSTEHNIDAWWCFDLAADLYGDAGYRAAADRIKAALETDGWNEARGIFWQGGIYAAGHNTPDGQHALDMMSWGGFVLNRWG